LKKDEVRGEESTSGEEKKGETTSGAVVRCVGKKRKKAGTSYTGGPFRPTINKKREEGACKVKPQG